MALVGLLLAAASALGAPLAHAATVSVQGDALRYDAAPGEANNVQMWVSGTQMVVWESSVSIVPGPGCTSGGLTSVYCTLAPVRSLAIDTGDMNDAAQVYAAYPTTFYDGAGDDRMTGAGGADTFAAGTGADYYRGGGGLDTVDYGARTEPLTVDGDNTADDGEAGERDNVQSDVEAIIGGSSPDTLTGSGSANQLDGRGGEDTLSGRGGNDVLRGGSGDDVLAGEDGNDTLDGGAGADQMAGGNGTDSADYSARTAPVSVTLDGAANDGEAGEHDTIAAGTEGATGGSGADTLTGDSGANTLRGGGGDDRIDGSGGNDTLDGGAGADLLHGGSGQDSLAGGDGVDTADYSDSSAPLAIDLDNSADDGEPGERDNVRSDVENVTGGSGPDRLTGSAGPNHLAGGAGDDVLMGGAGGDVLDGGAGYDSADYSDRRAPVTVSIDGAANDGENGESDNVLPGVERLVGGSAADRLVGDDGPNALAGGGGADYLVGQGGADSLDGGSGDDILDGGSGPDVLAGGDGSDRADYALRTAPLTVTIDDQPGDGEAGEGDNVRTDVEKVTGGFGADHLIGSGADNRLEGGPGDDVLDGGRGADAMAGGPGIDTVDYSGRTAGVTVTIDEQANDGEPGERDNVQGGVDNVRGGAGADVLTGSSSDNRIEGGAGDDRLSGGEGDDAIFGGTGRDTISGGKGRDRLYGEAGADRIAGRDGTAEPVSCGSGGDAVDPDAKDRLSSCERRFRGGSSPAPASGGKPKVSPEPKGPNASLARLAGQSNHRLHRYPSVRTALATVSPCSGAGPLVPAWIAAGRAFGIKWQILAAITQIESGYGCNMGPSKAGAIGWTQFMPATWHAWGMDASGDRKASPYNSTDAIFSTARYLRASGAPHSYRRAIYAYNHAWWYVRDVLNRAKQFGV